MFTEEVVADVPLQDPEKDLLGYKDLAKNLAEILCRNYQDEGLVFALCGSWGCGKSTFLNFVLHYINKKPSHERPITIRFNPWWFSGHADLLDRFLRELQMSFGRNKLKDLAGKLADFVSIVSDLPEPTGMLRVGGRLASQLRNRKRQAAAWEVKEQICTLLRKQERHVVVVIDDIDRLSAEEIKDLFRVIKAVADFPRVHYLLAFDRRVVAQALGGLQGLSGEDYLAKIVQITFDLPAPDKISLRRVFLSGLNEILAGTPEYLIDEPYFYNLYWDGIDQFLKTMRDVKRLLNTLAVDYPLVRGEVNPQDFIALETIRTFVPSLYYTIRANPEMFAGHSDISLIAVSGCEKLRAFHQQLLNSLPEQDREYLKNILRRLFPKLEGIEGIFGNIRYGPRWEPEWRKKLRISSLDCFPVYFRLSLPEGSPSNAEMQTLLNLTADKSAFGDRLVELSQQHRPDGTTRVSTFLERLWDFADKDIPKHFIPNVLGAVFDVGDQLLVEEDEPRGLLGWDNDDRIHRLVFQLLKRFDTQQERFGVLRDAFAAGRAVYTIVHHTAVLGQQDGKYGTEGHPEEEQLVGYDHLEVLEKIALQKIKEAAEKDELVRVPHLAYILYRWRDWEAEDAPRNWILHAGLLDSDEDLADLLAGFLSRSYVQAEGDRVAHRRWRLDPRILEPFLDPSVLVERCRSLLRDNPEWLTGRRKIALETFVKEYELLRLGKNPEEAWEYE